MRLGRGALGGCSYSIVLCCVVSRLHRYIYLCSLSSKTPSNVCRYPKTLARSRNQNQNKISLAPSNASLRIYSSLKCQNVIYRSPNHQKRPPNASQEKSNTSQMVKPDRTTRPAQCPTPTHYSSAAVCPQSQSPLSTSWPCRPSGPTSRRISGSSYRHRPDCRRNRGVWWRRWRVGWSSNIPYSRYIRLMSFGRMRSRRNVLGVFQPGVRETAASAVV